MTGVRKEYKFMWFIENYSYCCHEHREKLVCPEFTADGLEGTAWILSVYPRGSKEEDKGYISLFLNRSGVDDGPENISLDYELSVLAADGSALFSKKCRNTFKLRGGYGCPKFIPVDDVLLRRKGDYLPQDSLRVCCKMWKGEGDIQKVGQCTARTRIGIEKISFIHKVKSFSTLEPNVKKTLHIGTHTKTGCIISSSLYVTNDSCCEGKITVEIVPSVSDCVLLKQKLSLLDRSGNATECGKVDRFSATREDIRKLSLSLTRTVILNRKSEYLPKDELSLLCKCTFSTGVELEKIEETEYVLPITAAKQSCNNAQKRDGYNAAEKLSACTSASEDMEAIYVNQCLTDVVLKTKTKTFPAHKIVLCARSSVFKAMLTNDMKEKNTDCIQVDDLENYIVQQLLLFLYSDKIESLQWESAIKLYYAADKYAIDKMKVLCSAFLVDNLSTSTASELLLLADTHNDSDLKNFVEDFILEHEDDVFGSDEWEKLIETNPQLVIKTMHLKYKRGKGGK
ncbi:TD and POZ domain-containing protein 5 [Araneus ventricosus]|uniref:TD and POZ domain-containing protein 5 n=1 Tax=Araneus ventricosus TaxID=182803 RepID=A0A4Y2L2D9_ARAVE|nr:TD and POZ domain-containing protein 5 [Araneus ventricosus]